MKNLVLGFSTNQKKEDILVFCRSLRAIYSRDECDLIIITNKYHDYLGELAQEGVQFIPTVSEFVAPTGRFMRAIRWATLNGLAAGAKLGLGRLLPGEVQRTYRLLYEAWHHPHMSRWLGYARFLSLNRGYDQVLLADVRDVAFQAPFFHAPRDKVGLFTELEAYGSDAGFNTSWYRNAWGERDLQDAAGRLPVCIGTILGPCEVVIAMVDEIVNSFVLRPSGGVEQAIFNGMLIKGLIRTPYDFVPNVEGPVATLSSPAAKAMTRIDDGLICRVGSGTPVPIVHMYDRFPDTRGLYDGYLKDSA